MGHTWGWAIAGAQRPLAWEVGPLHLPLPNTGICNWVGLGDPPGHTANR